MEAQFPKLEALAFRGLWFDDNCRFLAVLGNSFSSDPSNCTVAYDDTMGPLGLFDAQALDTLDDLISAFRGVGIDLTTAHVKPTADGRIGAGSFFVDGSCDAFTYDPAWTSLPLESYDDPNNVAAVNGDWYWSNFCA
jgi:hypothetical protein